MEVLEAARIIAFFAAFLTLIGGFALGLRSIKTYRNAHRGQTHDHMRNLGAE